MIKLKQIFFNFSYLLYSLLSKTWKSKTQYIFIFGHMRSGSSLLVQVLRNNSEIIGIGESHLSYDNELSLGKLCCKVSFYNSIFYSLDKYKYVLDKILHTHYLPEQYWPLLIKYNIKVLLLIREPSGALKSLQKSLNFNFDSAVKHYIERLKYVEALSTYLKKNSINYFFLTYDELLANSEATLEGLSSFLELKEPLTQYYEIQSTTGKIGFGDFSNKILLGKIQRNESAGEDNKTPAYIMDTYQTVWSHLQQNAKV